MRLLRGQVLLVLDEYGYTFELGKAKTIRDGNDVLIISSGLMTMRALEVAALLDKESTGVSVLHVPTIKPLDTVTIIREVSRPGRLVMVAEKPYGHRRPRRINRHGLDAGWRKHAIPAYRNAGQVPRRWRLADTP